MSESIDAAIRGCSMLRQAERLLASAGFYNEAADVRRARESAEACTESSVRDLRPSTGEYSPKTIGQLVSDELRDKEPRP